MRKILFQVHLWSGLILSLPFLLLGITGSLLVFDTDIIGALRAPPALHASAGAMRSPSSLANLALEANPSLHVLSVTAPAKPGDPALVRLSETAGGGGRGGPPATIVSLDPVSGAVLRTEKQPNYMLMPVHFFHEDFMLGGLGRQIVGWSGVAMLIMGMSGMILWWPRKKQWGRAFTIRPNARGYVFNRDLHGALGIWMWLIFITVTFTGVYIVFPKPINAALGVATPAGPGGPPPGERAGGANGGQAAQASAVDFDTALQAAKAAAPDAQLLSVNAPQRPGQPVRVVMAQPGWRAGAPSMTISVAADGRVSEVRDPRKYSFGESFQAWGRALHEGNGLGIIYKVLVFLSGLLPPTFVVTGLLMWLQKRKNKAAAADTSEKLAEASVGS
jgi:uncharacterized iron-regulated membrane protein